MAALISFATVYLARRLAVCAVRRTAHAAQRSKRRSVGKSRFHAICLYSIDVRLLYIDGFSHECLLYIDDPRMRGKMDGRVSLRRFINVPSVRNRHSKS